MFVRDRIFWSFCLLTAIVAVSVALCCPTVSNDCINRFAPMAEAFAEGNWQETFHPRFGFLFQLLTGTVVFVTGLGGDVACSLVGVIGWALCMVPLYLVVRHVFGERAAKVAVILYVVAPMPFAWALRGLRESYRLLGSLLMVWGVMRCHSKMRGGFAAAAAGAAVLAGIRADTMAVAGVLSLVYAVGDRFRLRSWLLFVWLALVLQPSCLLTWKWTGWWVPSSQYIPVIEMLGRMMQ